MSFELVCADCGHEETFARDPAREVPCPACFAPIGSPCRKPSEHLFPKGTVHNVRDVAALEAGAYGAHRQRGQCKISHPEAVNRARKAVRKPPTTRFPRPLSDLEVTP